MWGGDKSYYVWIILILWGLTLISACSAQRHSAQHDDLFADTSDPFDDPFFTQPPEWDNSVLQESEVLAEDPEEPEKPKSFAERSQEAVFSVILVGASLGQLALPLLGLGF